MTGPRTKLTDPLALQYLAVRRKIRSRIIADFDRLTLITFYRWLDGQNLKIEELDRQLVAKFLTDQRWKVEGVSTRRYALKGYLRWLHKAGRLARDDDELIKPHRLQDSDLVPIAYEFQLAMQQKWRSPLTFSRSRYILYHFHFWLDHNSIDLSRLKRERVERFCKKLEEKALRPSYLTTLRTQLSLYFDWLSDRGILKNNFEGVLPVPRGTTAKNIPSVGINYLKSLASVHRPKTISAYKSSLAVFHTFMLARDVSLDNLHRSAMLAWMQDLHSRKLKVATRKQFLHHVRAYLFWLHENGAFKHDPRALIQPKDLPKRPKLLPRPFPPDVDAEIVRRLEQSDDIYAQGLLLMRLTGIRVGELHNLSFDCVIRDFNANPSLKVPVGKLNSERLVPIDEKVVNVINRIRAMSQTHSERFGRGGKCQYLIIDPTGRQSYYFQYLLVLKSLTRDIDDGELMVTHRLRHTYATSMLNAGMSIFSVMRVLGHTSITTTMIYASVTLDTVRREYGSAQKKLADQYQMKPSASGASNFSDPTRALDFSLKIIRKTILDTRIDTERRKLLALEKRLARLKYDVSKTIQPPRAKEETL